MKDTDTSGQALTEYALLVGAAAGIVVSLTLLFAPSLGTAIERVGAHLSTQAERLASAAPAPAPAPTPAPTPGPALPPGDGSGGAGGGNSGGNAPPPGSGPGNGSSPGNGGSPGKGRGA